MANKWREIAGGFDQYPTSWTHMSAYELAVKSGYKGSEETWREGMADASPTESSDSLITSGAVYAALQDLKAEILEELAEAELQPEEET